MNFYSRINWCRLIAVVITGSVASFFYCAQTPLNNNGNDAVSIPLSTSYAAPAAVHFNDSLSITSIFPRFRESSTKISIPSPKMAASASFKEARVMVLNEFNAQSMLAGSGKGDFYCALSASNCTAFFGKKLDQWNDLLTSMSHYISLDIVYSGTLTRSGSFVQGDIMVRTGTNLVLVCFIDYSDAVLWTSGAEYIHNAEALKALVPHNNSSIADGWQADAVWDSAASKYDTTVWEDRQYSQTQIRDSVGIFTGYVLPKVGVIGYSAAYADSSCAHYRSSSLVSYTDSVTDIDGNTYHAVTIGTQTWLVEDLRTTKYSDGTPIALDTSSVSWTSATTPNYCYYNNTTNADSIKKFGALYNWYVVNPANPNTIAPAGWHVSSDAEWDTLQNYLIAKGYNWDGTTDSNKIAKSLAVKTDWATDNITGTIGCELTKNNTSGFSAMPAGYRNYNGFGYRSSSCAWWSATENNSAAWTRTLNNNGEGLYRVNCGLICGFSVRLVRN